MTHKLQVWEVGKKVCSHDFINKTVTLKSILKMKRKSSNIYTCLFTWYCYMCNFWHINILFWKNDYCQIYFIYHTTQLQHQVPTIPSLENCIATWATGSRINFRSRGFPLEKYTVAIHSHNLSGVLLFYCTGCLVVSGKIGTFIFSAK